MNQYVHVQKPEITAKELAAEIWGEIGSQNNAYYRLLQIKKILCKYDLQPMEDNKPTRDCFGE